MVSTPEMCVWLFLLDGFRNGCQESIISVGNVYVRSEAAWTNFCVKIILQNGERLVLMD